MNLLKLTYTQISLEDTRTCGAEFYQYLRYNEASS